MPTSQRKKQFADFVRHALLTGPIYGPFAAFPDAIRLEVRRVKGQVVPEILVFERGKGKEQEIPLTFEGYFGYSIEEMDWNHLGSLMGRLEEEGHVF